jgi:hypothetical protein
LKKKDLVNVFDWSQVIRIDRSKITTAQKALANSALTGVLSTFDLFYPSIQ